MVESGKTVVNKREKKGKKPQKWIKVAKSGERAVIRIRSKNG